MITKLPWHKMAEIAIESNRILILYGDPGTGKTAWCNEQCLRQTGKPPQELQGGPTVDNIAMFGHYMLQGESMTFVDGPLTVALKQATWLVVNDAAHIPFAQISNLLPLRSKTHNVADGAMSIANPLTHEMLTLPPAFRLILTMNKESMACRSNKLALQSLIDDSLVVDIPPICEDVAQEIVYKSLARYGAAIRARTMESVREYMKAVKQANSSPSTQSQVGLRAWLQFASLVAQGNEASVAAVLALAGKELLNKEAFEALKLQFGINPY